CHYSCVHPPRASCAIVTLSLQTLFRSDPPLKSDRPLCSDRFRLLQDFRRKTARRQGNGRFSPELQPAAALSGMSPGEGRPDARSGRHAVVASILFHPPAPVPHTKYTLTS